jgi:hypothetical protein
MENHEQVPSDPAAARNRLGVIALILSLIPLPMAGLYVLVYYLLINSNLPYELALIISFMPLCFSAIGVIAAFLAIILGVISLIRREPRKFLAILAILLSIPFGLVMCALALVVTLMSRT